MNKFETALKLLEERYGQGKEVILGLATISMTNI